MIKIEKEGILVLCTRGGKYIWVLFWTNYILMCIGCYTNGGAFAVKEKGCWDPQGCEWNSKTIKVSTLNSTNEIYQWNRKACISLQTLYEHFIFYLSLLGWHCCWGLLVQESQHCWKQLQENLIMMSRFVSVSLANMHSVYFRMLFM